MVSDWTGVPVTTLTEAESARLLGLEEALHRRVVGQEEAAVGVARAIRRGRVGLKEPGRPTGRFSFLGPTGVGKTELCKALAATLFGSEEALLRFDMSEYMESTPSPASSAHRRAMWATRRGAAHREGAAALLRGARRDRKAHPDIWGSCSRSWRTEVTDAQGRKAIFKRHRGGSRRVGGRAYHRQRGDKLGFSAHRAAGRQTRPIRGS